MWVKSQLTNDGIELFWQARTRVHNGQLSVYDANGQVESSRPRARAVYPDPMTSSGIIPLDDKFVDFFGAENFDDIVGAIMKHVAHLVACGYGESPEEVIEWFLNVKELSFVDGINYRFKNPIDPFIDLDGLACFVERGESGFLINVKVGDHDHVVPIEGGKMLISFIISTIPV